MRHNPYNPKTVLRHLPNTYLQEFFSRYDDFVCFDWAAIKENGIEPLFDAWQKMPESQRKEASDVFRRIHAFATPRGTAVLVESAREMGIDIAPAMRALRNAYERAFWVFLKHSEVFESACTPVDVASLPMKYWEKCACEPRLQIEVTSGVIEEMSREMSSYYLARQGRGDTCKVEYRRRDQGVHVFFAYPSDYTDQMVGYDDDGELVYNPWHPAFVVVFRYDENTGTLGVFAEGGTEIREDLAEIFAQVILHEEHWQKMWTEHAYDLEPLKDRNLTFPTDPNDHLDSVSVKGMRLQVHERPGGTITLDVDDRNPSSTVHSLIDAALDREKVSLSKVTVQEAKCRAVFRSSEGGDRCITFTVAAPSQCDLGDSSEEEKLKRYLRVWGIERDEQHPL